MRIYQLLFGSHPCMCILIMMCIAQPGHVAVVLSLFWKQLGCSTAWQFVSRTASTLKPVRPSCVAEAAHGHSVRDSDRDSDVTKAKIQAHILGGHRQSHAARLAEDASVL